MAWNDTIRDKLRNPVVAGLAVGGVGVVSYLLVRTLTRGDGWGRPGDTCPIEIYTDELGDEVGERAWHFMPWLRHAADAFGVDPTLLAGLVQTESAFSPTAGSSAGALGLSQHIKSTALSRYKKLAEDGKWPFGPLRHTDDPQEAYFAEEGYPMTIDRLDPKQSLWLGAASLKAVLNAGKGFTWALAAYNAGPGTANKPQSQWPNETQAYVVGVPKRQKHYQSIAQRCGAGALA